MAANTYAFIYHYKHVEGSYPSPLSPADLAKRYAFVEFYNKVGFYHWESVTIHNLGLDEDGNEQYSVMIVPGEAI